MVYSRAWDEAAPAGSVDANTIDTEIQNVKEDVRERMNNIVRDWDDDSVDPKPIKIATGVFDDRPAEALPPDTGEGYFATDLSTIYFFDGTQWVRFTPNMLAVEQNLDGVGGAQVTLEETVDQVVSIRFSGTTDGSGDLLIDLTEIADYLGTETGALEHRHYFSRTQTVHLFIEVSFTSNTATIRAFDVTGIAVTSTSIAGSLLLFVFNAAS